MPITETESALVAKIKLDLVAAGIVIKDPEFSQMWGIIIGDILAHLVANITVTVAPGQTVANAPPFAGAGATTTPGTGNIT